MGVPATAKSAWNEPSELSPATGRSLLTAPKSDGPSPETRNPSEQGGARTSELIKSVHPDRLLPPRREAGGSKSPTSCFVVERRHSKDSDFNNTAHNGLLLAPSGTPKIKDVRSAEVRGESDSPGFSRAPRQLAEKQVGNRKEKLATREADAEQKTISTEETGHGDYREAEDEDEEEEMDKSTPETVINNSVRGRGIGPEDASGNEGTVSGVSVLEWARRKKRKVQSQLKAEEQQRSVLRRNVINRATATEMEHQQKKTNSKSSVASGTSWSVTVAGSYHPNMAAPDLQMRLSFPGTRSAAVHQTQLEHSSSSVSGLMNWSESPQVLRPGLPPPRPITETPYGEEMVPELDLDRVAGEDFDDHEDSVRQVLPVIDLVPKRKSLMRAPLDDCKSIS